MLASDRLHCNTVSRCKCSLCISTCYSSLHELASEQINPRKLYWILMLGSNKRVYAPTILGIIAANCGICAYCKELNHMIWSKPHALVFMRCQLAEMCMQPLTSTSATGSCRCMHTCVFTVLDCMGLGSGLRGQMTASTYKSIP